MAINLHIPEKAETLRPTITVVGVGGAGGNAVNNMISANLEGVSFVVANTDAQALENSLTENRIQLGTNLTRGLGAGAKPETGRAAAEEALDEIAEYIEGSNMLFITAGMGGGTGTGAAPVIARYAKERGILTVGVVTKPFQFEGSHRMHQAEAGVRELQQFVDTLIVIPNQNLFRIANEKTTFADAFRMADEVLHSGVRGVTDLMIMPGLINLDFADIRTVMSEMGKAMMGTGEGEGAKRAIDAAEAAISNPLLDDVSMKGAKGVLINITGSYDMTLFEADEAASRIREEVDPNANIIFGATFNPALEGKMRVSVVATGIEAAAAEKAPPKIPEAARYYAGKLGFVGARAPQESARFVAPPAAAVRSEPESARRTEPAVEQKGGGESKITKNSIIAFAGDYTTFIGAVKYTEEKTEPPQQAVPAIPRTPSFVTPPAAQPAQRSFFSQAPESGAEHARRPVGHPLRSSGMRGAPEETERKDRDSGSNGAANFLHRMANVGRVLTAKAAEKPQMAAQPERSAYVAEKAKVEVTERNSKTATDSDYLEIPAFLRRQAN